MSKEQEDKLSLTVQKRNGNLEPFDQEKMARAVSRAGTPFVMALDIAKTIKNNKELVQKNMVSSGKPRQLVTQELRNRNESNIAESYSGYSKNKVTTDIREEITSSNNKYYSKAGGRTTRTHAKQFAMDRNKGASRGSIGRQRHATGGS
jgi:transcriptional regulator NrdR family protein